MKDLINLIKNTQIVFTLIKNPTMKGVIDYEIIEQSTDFKFILNEQREYYKQGKNSLINISFRLKGK